MFDADRAASACRARARPTSTGSWSCSRAVGWSRDESSHTWSRGATNYTKLHRTPHRRLKMPLVSHSPSYTQSKARPRGSGDFTRSGNMTHGRRSKRRLTICGSRIRAIHSGGMTGGAFRSKSSVTLRMGKTFKTAYRSPSILTWTRRRDRMRGEARLSMLEWLHSSSLTKILYRWHVLYSKASFGDLGSLPL